MHSQEETVVRLATADDLAICLFFESLDEFGRQTQMDRQIMEANLHCKAVFLAEQRARPVGYASLNFLYASKWPLLSWWFVDPHHRNMGIGSLLRQAIKGRLRALGFTELLISACRPQEVARHRGAGLREIGVLNLGADEAEYFFVEPLLTGRR